MKFLKLVKEDHESQCFGEKMLTPSHATSSSFSGVLCLPSGKKRDGCDEARPEDFRGFDLAVTAY